MTAKETRQEDLEKRNRKLAAAVNQASEAIIITDREGRIEYVNPEFTRQTGFTLEELTDTADSASIHYDQKLEKKIVATVLNGNSWQGREEVMRKDGTLFTASISISPILDESGKVISAVAIQEDITKELAMDQHYYATQKREAIATLVSGIAHDFNNLLSGILGNLYLAVRETSDKPKTSERLKKVQEVVQEAAAIVRQLMSFSRSEMMETKEFPLNSFLKELIKLAGHTVPDNVQLHFDFDSRDYPVKADADQVQQAIMNIILNSVDALSGHDQGNIKVKLERFEESSDETLLNKYPILQEKEFAHISIWDDGEGIDEAHIDRVFDPFFTTKQVGSGLGLAQVSGCMQQHHGLAYAESMPGEGTTFHLYIPLLGQSDDDRDIPDSEHVSGANIMLVDDDTMVRETCAELLSSMGHNVVTAVDGKDAVEQFEEVGKKVDLVIMDIVMPRMNGPSAVQQIRILAPEVPVIFATAYDQSLSKNSIDMFKRSILINKPYDPEHLQQLIDGFLS